MLTNKNIIDTLLIGSLVESKRYTQNFAFYKAYFAEIIDNDFAVYVIGNKAIRKSIDQARLNLISNIAESMNVDGLIVGHMELFKKNGLLNSIDADTNIEKSKLNITDINKMQDTISKNRLSITKHGEDKQGYTEEDVIAALEELSKLIKIIKNEVDGTKQEVQDTRRLLRNPQAGIH